MGSEMCIRDRASLVGVKSALLHFRLWRKLRARFLAPSLPTGPFGPPGSPVGGPDLSNRSCAVLASPSRLVRLLLVPRYFQPLRRCDSRNRSFALPVLIGSGTFILDRGQSINVCTKRRFALLPPVGTVRFHPPVDPIHLEQVVGIEPARPAWKAGVLPLNYTCISPTRIALAPLERSAFYGALIYNFKEVSGLSPWWFHLESNQAPPVMSQPLDLRAMESCVRPDNIPCRLAGFF